jgi:hypothetical protein
MVLRMLLPAAPPRARARSTALVAAVVLLLAVLTPATSAAPASEEARSQAGASGPAGRFSVATLNLRKGMRVAGMRHDIRQVIGGGASVVGFQERLFSRPALRASLPKSWTLLMPSGPTGTDDNPIAFDKDVWKLEKTWPALLTGRTWRRPVTGRVAHDQYGVVAVLRHRRSGHVIRAVSFHLPNHLHNRRTGGPNYANRGGVEAMWRMAARVRSLKENAPEEHQFVAMCDCNVTENRDTTDHLVKGRITRPLRLETNYSGRKGGSGIDYVMAERASAFRIDSFRAYRHLVTDHPGIVATFARKR